MTQPYLAAESSVQDGRPVELYSIALPSASYYLTGYGEDVSYGGVTFVDTQISRGNITHVPIQQTREMVVSIPLTHALAQELLGNGISPRAAFVSIVRVHRADSGIVYVGSSNERQIWSGHIQGVQTDGQWVRMRVPHYFDSALDVKLPLCRLTRSCQHVHYGPGCGLNRNNALIQISFGLGAVPGFGSPTVVTASGINVEISSVSGKPDQWFKHGEIIRKVDGERRSILDQVGTTLVIDLPFKTLNTSDAVELWAGCDRVVQTCDTKFSNNHNFGGHTDVPTSNPAAPTGRGLR